MHPLNDSLLRAVEAHDLKAVQHWLERGADPNYTTCSDEENPDGCMQPTTPLRMVMFCISDALLDDDGLRQFAEIARLLLKHGANPKPAMEIAESRYGKYDPNFEQSLFMDVWHIVANAMRG